MRVNGEWLLCDDGIERPVIRGEVATHDGLWLAAEFLVDTGADRTVLTTDMFSALGFSPTPAHERIQGVGGFVDSVVLETRIRLSRDDTGRVVFRGRHVAVTDGEALEHERARSRHHRLVCGDRRPSGRRRLPARPAASVSNRAGHTSITNSPQRSPWSQGNPSLNLQQTPYASSLCSALSAPSVVKRSGAECAMAHATRTFRIFVSSTFSDLKEERNALQKYVFPRPFDGAQGRSAGAVCAAWLPLSGDRSALGRAWGGGARPADDAHLFGGDRTLPARDTAAKYSFRFPRCAAGAGPSTCGRSH